MAKSVYFDNCIREIRQSVFGRDNRKPIADAILAVKAEGYSVIVKWLIQAIPVLNTNVVDRVTRSARTVNVVTYCADVSSTANLAVSQIQGSDYLLTDTKSGDTATLISGQDYLFTMGGSGWSASEVVEQSYTVYDDVPHYETYTLVLRAAGE